MSIKKYDYYIEEIKNLRNKGINPNAIGKKLGTPSSFRQFMRRNYKEVLISPAVYDYIPKEKPLLKRGRPRNILFGD